MDCDTSSFSQGIFRLFFILYYYITINSYLLFPKSNLYKKICSFINIIYIFKFTNTTISFTFQILTMSSSFVTNNQGGINSYNGTTFNIKNLKVTSESLALMKRLVVFLLFNIYMFWGLIVLTTILKITYRRRREKYQRKRNKASKITFQKKIKLRTKMKK